MRRFVDAAIKKNLKAFMGLVRPAAFAAAALCGPAGAATAFKWAGGKEPGKLTTPKTGPVDIGQFINLASKEEWGNVIYNIANKYPGAKPWITWGVGTWPEAASSLSDDQHEEYLTYLDGIGVEAYLEVRPGSADVVGLIDTYMKKFSRHPCVKGFGVDLEFYAWKGNKDDDAKAMDVKLKSFNPAYRLFFKHWEAGNMPNYRGAGDLIFFCTSSESSPATLTQGDASFCNSFVANGKPTAACAFQIGYPADEPLGSDHIHNGPYDGWSKFQDPIKDWGDALLKAVTSSTMELGFVWVTVKSDRIAWDLTKGASIPTRVIPGMHAFAGPSGRMGGGAGRFLRVEYGSSGLTVKLADGGSISVPAAADIMGRKVTAVQSGLASGRYFQPMGGATPALSVAR